MEYYDNALQQHLVLFEKLNELQSKMEEVASACVEVLNTGGKIMLCGNGGSSADAQHIAAEFTGRFVTDRRPLAALSLTTDTSALTCISNDYGYEHVFSRQLRALGRAGDILFLITTSGNSENVKNVMLAARELNIRTVAVTGSRGRVFATKCDYGIVVDSDVTARIQEAHIFLLHTLCGLVERGMDFD